jgi:hypothetical protein
MAYDRTVWFARLVGSDGIDVVVRHFESGHTIVEKASEIVVNIPVFRGRLGDLMPALDIIFSDTAPLRPAD